MSAMDNGLVAEYLKLKAIRDKAEREYQDAAARLMKQMEADQRKSYRWTEEGHAYNLTYVQNHTTVIDEPGLRKALTARVFDKYTVRKLDRKRMEEAMDAGRVDPLVVAKYVEIRANKPFLKYSEKDTHE